MAPAEHTPPPIEPVPFETVLRSTPAIVAVMDARCVVRYANDAYYRARRVGPADVLGHTLEDLLGPAGYARVRPYVDEALAGRVATFESWFDYPTIGHRFTEVTYTPLCDPNGTVEFVSAVLYDVTDRKLQENSQQALLADARRRIAETAAIFTAQPDAILIYDLGLRVVRATPAFEPVYGFDPTGMLLEEIVQRVSARHLDGSAFGASELPSVRALRGEIVRGFRSRLNPPGRPGMVVETSSGPLVLENEIVGAVTVWRDVTAAVQAEERLRASEERLRLFVEYAPAAIAMLDREMCYLAASRRWLEDYHLKESDIIGRSHYEIFPEIPERWKEIHRRCLAGAVERADEDPFPRADGSLDWVRWEIRPFYEKPGVVGGLLVFSEVITERKRAEEALLEADRRKDEFLGLLSHELRNPLAPIRNSLFVMDQTDPASPQSIGARRIIDRQVRHLTRLVDDLLDTTRIRRGKIQLRHERLELRELVRRVAEDVASLFTDAGIALEIVTADEPLWLEGDAIRLAQVFGNLLQNSVKFTPHGGVTVLSVTGEDASAVVRVRDTGAGIEPELLPRLFEPFTQADRTLERSRGGLGLGLALVHGLVTLHGGTVEASSAGSGQGAEFVVRLPLAATVREVPAHAPTVAAPRSVRRVLVIEDNPDTARSLVEALRVMGHTVEAAPDGLTGIDAAHRMRPDIVLCDIGLPNLDGYDVARALRADPILRGVLLVAVSGYARPEDVERGREAGFDHHIAKPADVAELERLLAAE